MAGDKLEGRAFSDGAAILGRRQLWHDYAFDPSLQSADD
jgi:hypothetical protein